MPDSRLLQVLRPKSILDVTEYQRAPRCAHTLVYRHTAFQFSPKLTVNKREQKQGAQRGTHNGAHIVSVKSITIPLEVEYLEKAAKERGISRSKLVRFVMEKVVNDELVPTILGDDDLSNAEPSPRRYRRFRHPA